MSHDPSEQTPTSPEVAPGRRGLLLVAFWGGLTSLAGAGAGLVGGFLSHSLRRGYGEDTAEEGVSIGTLEELPSSGFARRVVEIATRRHWETTTVKHLVFVKRTEDEGVTAFLGRCSHMGCTVGWDEGDGSFHCPCHDGRFDEEGEVVAGPATSGLTRLPASVEDGDVRVELPS